MKFLFLLTIMLSVTLFATNLSDFINKKNCDQIIDKGVYTICYDYTMKGAKYIAYNLDSQNIKNVYIKKRPSFYTEKNLKKKHRATNKDYKSSGYDRGHLANHLSFSYDKKVLAKTYSLANYNEPLKLYQ